MQFNRYDIPGFREAVKAENDARDAAFLNFPTNICGIEIRQMTPRDWLILDGLECPVLSRQRMPDREEISDFIRFMSVKRKPWRHFWKMLRMDYGEALSALANYFAATIQDTPGGPKAAGITPGPIASWLAHRVDFLASEYGYSVEYILNMPLRIQNQLMNCTKHRHDPNYRVGGRSGKILSERLQRINGEVSNQ